MKKAIKIIILTILLIIMIIINLVVPVQAASSYNQVLIPPTTTRRNGIKSFPESYQKVLNKLVEKSGHKNWKFAAFYTDIDWNELVSYEHTHLRNTIYKNSSNPSSWYCSCNRQGDTNYFCASQDILEYYLDPRNFLTEIAIFQFLDLSNNGNMSVQKIENLVSGTFLDGSANGMRYAQMIYDAANASGESAYSLVIKIFQELGKRPKGDLPYMVSGKDPKYPNVYNFYNYGASDGADNIEKGLKYAYEHGWNTPYKAIVEGAKLTTSTYLKSGQNTKYTYKFDVVGSNLNDLYSHQFMTNVQDPNNQANMLYNAYNSNGYLNSDLTFIIPVYKNMPASKKLPSNMSGNLYYVSSDYTSVLLRSAPGGGSNLASVPKDAIVSVIQTGINGWAKVNYNGKEGYMSEAYLTQVNTKKDVYSVPPLSELPFEDVDVENWYYNSVKYCYDNKIILGTTNTTYNPNGKLTRGQLVTILWRMEGSATTAGAVRFPDVKQGTYYYEAIKWATNNKIVSGYNEGTFKPNNQITREQLATILRNYASFKGKDLTANANMSKFKDGSKISSYAVTGVNWAISKKIISGKDNGTRIDPRGTASRAEAAAMISNYCSYIGI